MKKSFLILILLVNGRFGFAQLKQDKNLTQYYIEQSRPCGGMEELLKHMGSWTKNEDAVVFPDKSFPSTQYSFVFSRLDKILPLLKEALPDLSGMQATWYRSIAGNSLIPNGPVPYIFRSSYPEYFCSNTKKIELNEEPDAWVNIFINEYNNWFAKKIDEWNINGDGKMIAIYQMPDTVGTWHGLRVYEPKIIPGTFDRAIVIGHNGKMPWFTLSQKQYLTGYKNFLEKNRKEQLESNDIYIKKMKENIVNMQNSKVLTPEQKKSVVEKLEQQLKEFQDNTMQKKIAAAEKIYNDNIKLVQEYLDTATTATLTQQAILDIRSNISFSGYFARPGAAGIKLIAFPSKYFNKQLPRYVPQFMIVYWHWGYHPTNLTFAKEFEENFPVEKLKSLIDQ